MSDVISNWHVLMNQGESFSYSLVSVHYMTSLNCVAMVEGIHNVTYNEKGKRSSLLQYMFMWGHQTHEGVSMRQFCFFTIPLSTLTLLHIPVIQTKSGVNVIPNVLISKQDCPQCTIHAGHNCTLHYKGSWWTQTYNVSTFMRGKISKFSKPNPDHQDINVQCLYSSRSESQSVLSTIEQRNM